MVSPIINPNTGRPFDVAQTASQIKKRTWFNDRVARMIGGRPDPKYGAMWFYYPAQARFVQSVSIQQAKWNDRSYFTRPRFLPESLGGCLAVYEREVYEAPEWKWDLFLEGHPRAIVELHAQFNAEADAGGLLDIDAFAAAYGHDWIKGSGKVDRSPQDSERLDGRT